MIGSILKNETKYRWILGILIVLWCSLIFSMSSETADMSAERSKGITNNVSRYLLSLFGIEECTPQLLGLFKFIVRKTAHVFLYFILAIMSSLFVYTYKISFELRYIFSFAFCVLYAVSDEIHQLFVEGRSGSGIDVLIDSIGIVFGILLVRSIYHIYKSRKISK